MRIAILFLLVTAALTGGVVVAQDATPEMTPEATLEPGPDLITIAAPGLMPEGIEYDPTTDTLLIGSLSSGTINHVNWDGTLTPLAQSENLTSSVGIQVDAANNRVLAAMLSGPQTGAGLGAYDLETGEELFTVDLTQVAPGREGYFSNDVAVDDAGNAYVTDSGAGVIYKVTPEGEASIFLEDESFAGQFVLNGITFHPDGYLLATRAADLIKIPLDDPAALSVVEMDPNTGGGDGIILIDPQTLIVVSEQVYRVESTDDWATAVITGDFEPLPEIATTAAVRGDEVYVVHANFANPQAEEYHIQKAAFEDVME